MTQPTTRLTIRFEGTEPSIKLHRLSVAVFANSLTRLVQALRRIASGIDTDAWGPVDYGGRGGRFTKEAEGLDWEISDINGQAPLEITGAVVQRFKETEAMLFELPESTELTDLAAERLLTALEKESSGHSYHKLVRRYLRSLPPLSRQEYEVSTTQGEILEPVVISTVDLPQRQEEIPYLRRVSGELIGVGFETGSSEIRLKTVDERLTLDATLEQVESALELRGEPVAAFYVKQPRPIKSRLLSISSSTDPMATLTSQEAEDDVFERWKDLLKRLAE